MNSDSADDWIDSLWQGRLVEPGLLKEWAGGGRELTVSTSAVAADLVRRGMLTSFQAEECLAGRGSRLAVGPYRLLEPLGAGTRGQVFRARHDATSRVVALKAFHPDRLPQADTTEAHQFHREAEAAARLRHPNLVSVLDDGTADGVRYLVMELVEGIDLPAFLESHGPLEPLQACRYAQQTALALQYAYEQRLVPCDVAASDLMVTDRGASVKLLSACRGRLGPSVRGLGEFDFGSLLEPGAAGQDEVAATLDAEALREDAQSAILGLGRVLRLMVSGRRARGDDDAEFPADLAAIVGTMVADNPARRYATPADCAAALARFCALQTPAGLEGAVSAPLESPKTGAPSLARSSVAFAVMILLGVLAGAAKTWFSSDDPTGPKAPPPPSPQPVASRSPELAPLPVKRPVKTPPPEDPRYRALVRAGTAELNRNAIPEALIRLGEAIRLRPDLAAAYTRRAEAYTRWEAYPDVVADCNQAIRLDPSDAVAYRLRGAALASLGDEGGAIADSTKAIELDAGDAHAFNTRGVAHFNRRAFRAACDDFTAAVRIDETLAGALGNLAWLLATAPESGIRNGLLAITHAKRACELTDWKDPVQLKNLAAAHAECHEFDRAIRFQKLALDHGRRLPGTVTGQYRSLLNRYRAGQPAPNGDEPSHAQQPATDPGQSPPLPVPSSTEMHPGVRPPPRPFPTFRDMPRTNPPPFVPLYRSG